MKSKKTIIAIILCIGAVISLVYAMTSRPKVKRKILPDSETISPAAGIMPTKRQAAQTKFVSFGRNPFAPRGSSIKNLILNGILWDKEKPLAIINNTTVSVGDKIDGNTIVDIKEDRVILSDGTSNIELKLRHEE